MKKTAIRLQDKTQLVLLVGAIAVLLVLSFLPDSRGAIRSSEVRFSELSVHGLNIIPASCASNAALYHAGLAGTPDGGGFKLPPTGGAEYGNYAGSAGAYVCAINNSANTYFIPAHSIGELNSFKAHPPAGVAAY